MSGTLYLHIGAPKAASTTLQKRVFPVLPRPRAIIKPRLGLVPRPRRWAGELASLMLHGPQVWSDQGQAFFSRLHKIYGAVSPAQTDLLLSDENMSVNRHTAPQHLAAHVQALAAQAREHGYSRLRILFVMRRQDEWLASAYAQSSHRSKVASQADFVRRIDERIGSEAAFQQRGVALDYAALYRMLTTFLDPEDLLFLPLEGLQLDATAFLQQVFDFFRLTADEVAALPDFTELAGQRLNVRGGATAGRSWQLRRRHPWSPRPGTIALTDELSAAIMNRYGPGNLALAQRLGIPLADYGYGPVAAGEGR